MRDSKNKDGKKFEDYEELYERLTVYGNSDYYPFHMPGHKRKEFDFENPYKIDITEIEGFDNLHHAKDVLLTSQERLRNLYQSRKSYFLINGSTCGLLSAVGALVRRSEQVIIARNCHKSVYNAIKIFGLKADYVYPRIMECGIQGEIDPYELEDMLRRQENIRLIVITSPTYDGIVSDIKKIAEISHKYHAWLIVDEAHGAHFSMNGHFPESAVRCGADIVIHSLHKTLTGFTQTAALHVVSNEVDCGRVEEMLSIFQSSSPSYLLMAGMERCVKMLEESRYRLFEDYYLRLRLFYQKCSQLKHLHVFTETDYEKYHIFDVDLSKILISTRGTPINGERLYRGLLKNYHLQMEMYSAEYVLAMTSIMDTWEGFERLADALLEMDQEMPDDVRQVQSSECFLKRAYAERKKILEVSDVEYYNKEETLLEECDGKLCAEYIYLYPPGIPIIVPGELMTDGLIQILEQSRNMGLNIQGTKDTQYRKILTVAHIPENRI